MHPWVSSARVGDLVELEFHDFEDKYIASISGGNIGYFPKAANDFLSECKYAFVDIVKDV